jgi:hypothetical protein
MSNVSKKNLILCDKPIKVTPCQKENLIKGSFLKDLVQKNTQEVHLGIN